jgi:hypothetical protein
MKFFKIFAFVFFSLNLEAAHSENTLMFNFGEVSAMYLGSCYAIEYLKNEKCRSIAALEPKQCQQRIIQLLPDKFRAEIDQMMTKEKQEIKENATYGVDVGFKKILNMTNNDLAKSCLGYATAMNTFAFSQFEELKRISKLIK